MIVSEELRVMDEVARLIEPLEPESRGRVVGWLVAKFAEVSGASQPSGRQGTRGSAPEDLPSLFDRAQPRTQAESALLVAYWLHQRQDSPDLDSAQINAALRDLGHGIPNITQAMTSLIKANPRLILQTKKTGNSRQSRKRYRVTSEGMKQVERMLGKEAPPWQT